MARSCAQGLGVHGVYLPTYLPTNINIFPHTYMQHVIYIHTCINHTNHHICTLMHTHNNPTCECVLDLAHAHTNTGACMYAGASCHITD